MKRYRAIWISDVHLGTTECKADYLLDFLKNNTAETIYLVGDIIDGWALKKRWYWPQKHNDVIQKLLRKARKGSKVIYIPGNHDELGRQFINMTFGDIEIKNDLIHTTLDGKRLWVTHGDLFDNIISYAKWLSFIGDGLYYVILRINHYSNVIRHKYGFHYWSFSSYIKNSIKNVVGYIENFEQLMAKEAKRKGIKIVALVDTNINPDIVDYPIPANDDAISSVRYIIEKVKETIQNSKQVVK